jgi:hypothetical protein
MALFGPGAMSDVSPKGAPKRTSADHFELMRSRPRKGTKLAFRRPKHRNQKITTSTSFLRQVARRISRTVFSALPDLTSCFGLILAPP